jgi:hypothetical protein
MLLCDTEYDIYCEKYHILISYGLIGGTNGPRQNPPESIVLGINTSFTIFIKGNYYES